MFKLSPSESLITQMLDYFCILIGHRDSFFFFRTFPFLCFIFNHFMFKISDHFCEVPNLLNSAIECLISDIVFFQCQVIILFLSFD